MCVHGGCPRDRGARFRWGQSPHMLPPHIANTRPHLAAAARGGRVKSATHKVPTVACNKSGGASLAVQGALAAGADHGGHGRALHQVQHVQQSVLPRLLPVRRAGARLQQLPEPGWASQQQRTPILWGGGEVRRTCHTPDVAPESTILSQFRCLWGGVQQKKKTAAVVVSQAWPSPVNCSGGTCDF